MPAPGAPGHNRATPIARAERPAPAVAPTSRAFSLTKQIYAARKCGHHDRQPAGQGGERVGQQAAPESKFARSPNPAAATPPACTAITADATAKNPAHQVTGPAAPSPYER